MSMLLRAKWTVSIMSPVVRACIVMVSISGNANQHQWVQKVENFNWNVLQSNFCCRILLQPERVNIFLCVIVCNLHGGATSSFALRFNKRGTVATIECLKAGNILALWCLTINNKLERFCVLFFFA